MRSRHLISNTHYIKNRSELPSAKMRYHENSFGELAKCNEIQPWDPIPESPIEIHLKLKSHKEYFLSVTSFLHFRAVVRCKTLSKDSSTIMDGTGIEICLSRMTDAIQNNVWTRLVNCLWAHEMAIMTLERAHKHLDTRVHTLVYFSRDKTNPQMTIKTAIFTHRPRVSLARFTLGWWCHNRLLWTSHWPDNWDTTTWKMISNSLDINFIHDDIQDRYKKCCFWGMRPFY